MRRNEQHPELPLSRAPDGCSVPIELVRRQHSAGSAFSLACQSSGLEDKELYMTLDIDAGTWSRMKKGEATLQADKLADFCRAVGNTIYLEWLAYQTGHTLVMIKTEAERRAEEAEKRARDAEAQVDMLKALLIGRAA